MQTHIKWKKKTIIYIAWYELTNSCFCSSGFSCRQLHVVWASLGLCRHTRHINTFHFSLNDYLQWKLNVTGNLKSISTSAVYLPHYVLCVCCFVSSSRGGRESICSSFLSDGCEHCCSVSGVCPLLDIWDGALLLQHSCPPHGRTGALPHHAAAAHHGLYR